MTVSIIWVRSLRISFAMSGIFQPPLSTISAGRSFSIGLPSASSGGVGA